jgi:hypothetical protein
MKLRLERLRKQIQKEREQRQQRLAGAASGHIWSSSSLRRAGNQHHNLNGRGNIALESSKNLLRTQPLIPEHAMVLGKPQRPSSSASKRLHSHIAAGRQLATELPDTTTEGTPWPSQGMPASIEQSSSQPQNPGSLLAGSFDEDRSRESFLMALAEWRGGKACSYSGDDGVGTRLHMEGDGIDASVLTGSPHPAQIDQTSSATAMSIFQRISMHRGASEASAAAAKQTQCCLHPSHDRTWGTRQRQDEASADGKAAYLVEHSQSEDSTTASGEQLAEGGGSAGNRAAALGSTEVPEAVLECGVNLYRACEGVCRGGTGLEEAEDGRGYLADFHDDYATVVTDIVDVSPMEALESGTRLPDAIVLPGNP